MNLLKLLLSIILITFTLICETTNAQHFMQTQNGVRFEIFSNFSEPPTLGDESNFVNYTVTNLRSSFLSRNYDVTMTISIQEQIRANDLDTTGILRRTIQSTNSGGVLFRLPNPDTMGPAPRLFGDSRSAADWIGEKIYCTLCVNDGSGDNCVVAIGVIHPKSPTFIDTQHDEEVNEATINWEALPKDRENKSIGSGHNVKVTHQSTGVEVFNEYILQNENDLVTIDNVELNELTLNQAELIPGEAYRVNVEACGVNNGSATVCSAPDPNATPPNNMPLYTKNIRAFALFPEPTVNAQREITVNWQQFSNTTQGYRFSRCDVSEFDPLPNCTVITLSNSAITFGVNRAASYVDRDPRIEPGREYRYEISACLDNENCGDGLIIRTGNTGAVTTPGDRLIKPDDHENDDNPKRLTKENQIIGANVNQDMRNFHTETDADWARIELRSGTRQLEVSTSSTAENVNTKVALANAEGELIACAYNTPNVITSHARLMLPNLPAGDYFLRVAQENVGLPLAPVEQYTLDVTISVNSNGPRIDEVCRNDDRDAFELAFGLKTTIAPVLDLLLE